MFYTWCSLVSFQHTYDCKLFAPNDFCAHRAPEPHSASTEGFSSLTRTSCLPDTHALVSLLQNLNKANYNLPIMVTDSGKPPMTNITDLRVQVCSCKNSKVDCNAAGTLHLSLGLLLLLSLLSLSGEPAEPQHAQGCAHELHHTPRLFRTSSQRSLSPQIVS